MPDSYVEEPSTPNRWWSRSLAVGGGMTVSMPNLADAEELTVRLSRVEADRLRAAAADRGVAVSDAVRAAVWLWLRARPAQRRTPLSSADYAEMGRSYEKDPPRREEMVGEQPYVAPSAMQADDED